MPRALIHLMLWPLWLVAILVVRPALASSVPVEVRVLDASQGDPSVAALTTGALDTQFGSFDYRDVRSTSRSFWL